MSDHPTGFRRYLPRDSDSEKWGWNLIDTGSQHIEPGMPYPPEGHPEAYLFDRNGYRVLQEYQMVLIAGGQGLFESASHPRMEVRAGDAFLVFPGERHRYRPDSRTGWREYWTGFEGPSADRLIRDFFPRDRPVFRNAGGAELLETFRRQFDILQDPRPGSEQVAASLILQQLSQLRFTRMSREGLQTRRREIVILAKAAILENPAGRTDFEELAQECTLSYSRFRKLFKAETGYAPRAFENELKLSRARDLLRSGRHNVNSVAEELGYSSVYYFSRAYKKRFGHPPSGDLQNKTL